MPRYVARYFMERRHHRRRIPTASRYISGCTVNPSGPAVRQLHRGRSPEFREWSPPPPLSLPLLYSRYVYVDTYVYVCASVCIVVLSPRYCGAKAAGLPLAGAPLPSRALERALPPLVVRVPRLLFLPEFFLLSTVRAPDYSRAPSTVFARRLGRRWIVSRSKERSFIPWYHCALYFNLLIVIDINIFKR